MLQFLFENTNTDSVIGDAAIDIVLSVNGKLLRELHSLRDRVMTFSDINFFFIAELQCIIDDDDDDVCT